MSQISTAKKYRIRRDGVSQLQRKLPALDPSFVQLDERTTQDFLLFAYDLSKIVKFYNQNDEVDGHWEEFWACSSSVWLATVEKYNPLPLRQEFFALNKVRATERSVEGIQAMFEKIRSLALQIDEWLEGLDRSENFAKLIRTLIGANLSTILPQLVGYEQGLASIFGPEYKPDLTVYQDLSQVWNLGDPHAVEADTGLFNPFRLYDEDDLPEVLPEPTAEEILTAAYQGLSELFTDLYNILFQIINAAPRYFEDTLKTRDHQPHLALFIAFLKLYEQVQKDLNKITGRHLDFYYQEVLKIELKDEVPDKVHLFFQLAKLIEEHQLKEDIRFKAGKDKTGKDLFYTLDKDAVLNQATVARLRTVYYADREVFFANGTKKNISGLYVAPVANSADGFGAKFPKTEEKPSWPTLGTDERHLANPGADAAAVGFAIASRELLLAEGSRTVTLKLTVKFPGNAPSLDSGMLEVSLSGEKQWIPVDFSEDGDEVSLSGNHLKIKFTLPPDADPVVGLDAKTLKTDYGTTLPVLRVLLRQFDEAGNPLHSYRVLRDAELLEVKLTVAVSGISSLLAFNDQGAVDPNKPFMPFGTTPKAGSSFYLGSAEAAVKSVDQVTLQITWQQVPDDLSYYYAGYNLEPANLQHSDFEVEVHSIGSVVNPSTLSKELFSQDPDQTSDSIDGFTDRKVKMIVYDTEAEDNGDGDSIPLANLLNPDRLAAFGQNNREGFLRFDLNRDFEHDQYPTVLTKQMLAASQLPNQLIGAWFWEPDTIRPEPVKNDGSNVGSDYEIIIPNAPYTPVIKSLSFGYTSVVTVNFADTSDEALPLDFLHIHPFESTYEELQPVPLAEQNEPQHLQHLVPQFREEGALYIGLEKLEPLQSLSLLFQVAENTADADLPKAEVQWAFLADNQWTPFDRADIPSDTTNGLITSGIIDYVIPAEIKTQNTILSSDLHWIKASVTSSAKAVSELIEVHAQAARVTFQDNGNDLTRLAEPLPAKQISKLEIGDASVKKIFQEYESFGGRPKEDSTAFYVRVSERLRHKGRAITIFDYERLVLEAFPDIYKVKCINHTNGEHQLRPGHVLVSVIPDFTKLKAVDRKQPKVTLSKLEEIKAYLDERNTTFVHATTEKRPQATLHVLNPIYEFIKVKFKVQFKPTVTAKDFRRKQLQEAIVRFLSPWAYENGSEINFGGKVFKSSILKFVEKEFEAYVDWVADFTIDHIFRKNDPEGVDPEVSFAEAKTPISILVPVDPDQMDICIVGEDCEGEVKCPENPVSGDTVGYVSFNGENYTVGK